MTRALNKLSAVKVRTCEPGKYSDGGGLWLVKRVDGGGQWVLRITIHGRRREMGLGSSSEVSLKEAREASEKWRASVRDNIDPIKEREKQRREAARNMHLLKDVALDAFESRKAELKGDGVAGRWFSPLELHILPKLGKVPVAEIDQTDIRDKVRGWGQRLPWAQVGNALDGPANRRPPVDGRPASLGPRLPCPLPDLRTAQRNRHPVAALA